MSERGAVSLLDLGKRHPVEGQPDGVWALRGLSLELPPGSALAVVGENGSGKSTLLDLLHGSTQPSEGRLDVGGPVAALLELGAGFFSELSGRENAVQAAGVEIRGPPTGHTRSGNVFPGPAAVRGAKHPGGEGIASIAAYESDRFIDELHEVEPGQRVQPYRLPLQAPIRGLKHHTDRRAAGRGFEPSYGPAGVRCLKMHRP